jgi:hypothetical protein
VRFLVVAVSLYIGAASQAAPSPTPLPCATAKCVVHVAPAPVIGAGIPAFLVVGGVLLGTQLVKRRRRS